MKSQYTLIHACVTWLVLLSGSAQCQWYANYKNLTDIYGRLDDFQTQYPNLVTSFSIGQSYEGREIRGIKIAGTGSTKSTKPAVLINGTQHAREWISPMTNMYAADQLLAEYGSDVEITEILDEVDVYVIPVVNPDGYEFSWASPASTNRFWRKNRRDNMNGTFGVDLNRNWGVGWGGGGSSGNPSTDTYRGTAPFSEPETAALRDFFLNNQNLVSTIDFHSFSQLILTPYGYSSFAQAPDGAMMMQVAHEMSQSIYSVHGERYTAQRATDLYLASGLSIDWTYDHENVYSYTIELRPAGPRNITSFALPANQILPTVEEAFEAVLDLGSFTASLAHGDFNYDTLYTTEDINALASGVVGGTSKAEYDVNGDALIDPSDVDRWLVNAGKKNLPGSRPYLHGDANLDGIVNQSDREIWEMYLFSRTSDWNKGDFNTDGIVNGLDHALWLSNAVPEPTAVWLFLTGAYSLLAFRSRRKNAEGRIV